MMNVCTEAQTDEVTALARLHRSLIGRIPAKTNKSSIGVGRRHPVTVQKTSLIGLFRTRVRALQHKTGKQYSAGECARARVAVRNVVAPTPQVSIPKISSKSQRVLLIFCVVTQPFGKM